MSLNNIQLSPQLLADLYPDIIIETPEKQPEKKPDFRFLGNNKKNILILVSKQEMPFLEDIELNFLSNILAACKFSLADVAIVNLQNHPAANYSSLIQFFNSKYVLLFDVTPQEIDLPFNFPYFQTQKFDLCTYLSAPALNKIETDKVAKTKLWTSLKNFFGL
jgi:hypothetical protein